MEDTSQFVEKLKDDQKKQEKTKNMVKGIQKQNYRINNIKKT